MRVERIGDAVLYLGDASATLLAMRPGSIHMAYLDPPFGTQKDWHGKAGSFSDRFRFDDNTRRIAIVFRSQYPLLGSLIDVLPVEDHVKAYLFSMSPILAAVRRSLAMTGSMWLHCDDTSGAYLKICADFIFGHTAWLGDIIWRRTASHNDARNYGRCHDTIFVYARSRVARWRLWRLQSEFALGDPCSAFGVAGFVGDKLSATAKERVGYPTQKPLGLVTRLILAATLPGETVLDPTCGSGTTPLAAVRCGRVAIGIDCSQDAIGVAGSRLRESIPRQRDLFAPEAA